MDENFQFDVYRKFRSEFKLLADQDGYLTELPIKLIRLPANLKTLTKDEQKSKLTSQSSISEIETIKVVVSIPDTLSSATTPNIFCFEGYDQLTKALVDGTGMIKCISKKVVGHEAVVAILEKHMQGHLDSARPHPIEIAADLKTLSEAGMKLKDMQFVLNKSVKTIARLRKIARWSDQVKDEITKDPKRFPARFIFLLASKRLSPTQVENEIRFFNPEHVAQAKKQKLLEKIESYFQENGFSETERKAVYMTLKFLKVI